MDVKLKTRGQLGPRKYLRRAQCHVVLVTGAYIPHERETMDIEQLTKERVRLLELVAELDKAIALLGGARPVEVQTHKNLRNTCIGFLTEDSNWWEPVVYSDKSLTAKAAASCHGGFITASAAAMLLTQLGEDRLYDEGIELT